MTNKRIKDSIKYWKQKLNDSWSRPPFTKFYDQTTTILTYLVTDKKKTFPQNKFLIEKVKKKLLNKKWAKIESNIIPSIKLPQISIQK